MKYEYETTYSWNAEQANDMAEMGWRLVAAVRESVGTRLIWERERPEAQKPEATKTQQPAPKQGKKEGKK